MRTLSSGATVVTKVLLPAMLIGIGAKIIAPLWLPPHTLPWNAPTGLERPWDRWGITLSWAAGLVLGLWYVLRLKRVRLDGDVLLISNYAREIQVPLQHVRGASIDTLGRSRWAVIDFDVETAFGTSISFLPKTLETATGVEYPVVDELRQLASHARQAKPNPSGTA